MQRKGNVMKLGQKTQQMIETKVSRKENFVHRNVSGKWQSPRTFNTSNVGWMDPKFAELLSEHNKGTDLYVLYSYDTPMAWFRLGDSDSQGNNKWYFPKVKYSTLTTGHQNIYKYALRGENVVTLTLDNDGNVTEDEKEYYS